MWWWVWLACGTATAPTDKGAATTPTTDGSSTETPTDPTDTGYHSAGDPCWAFGLCHTGG
jgi:hypothetical protein